MSTNHNPNPFNRYTFYVEDAQGSKTTWTGLSMKRARDMYAYTNASQPSNVHRFGWFEEKCPIEYQAPNLTNVSEGATA